MAELTDEQKVAARLLQLEEKVGRLNKAIPTGMIDSFDDAVENQVLQYALFVVIQEILQDYLRGDMGEVTALSEHDFNVLQQKAAEKRRQIAEQFVSGVPSEEPSPQRISEETI